MPAHADELWQHFTQSKFEEVKKMIETDAELVNVAKPEYSLLALSIHGQKPAEFINFLTAHPKIDLYHQNAKETNWKLILRSTRQEIIEPLLKRPDVLLYQNVLAYSVIQEKIAEDEESRIKYEKIPARAKLALNAADRVKKGKEIKEMVLGASILAATKNTKVRDALILQALKDDDADVLQGLEEVGVQPILVMNELVSKNQSFLLTEKNVKIGAWLRSQEEGLTPQNENMRRVQALETQVSDASNSFFNEQMKTLHRKVTTTLNNAKEGVNHLNSGPKS
jgi:hypothetical protein